MRNSSMQNVNKFFEDTSTRHNTKKEIYNFSRLYLLIRDIKACLGFNPDSRQIDENVKCKCGKERGAIAQWPAIMTILAGIDLLGKFRAGCDNRNKIGERFKNFVEEYFDIEKDDAEIIYELRNCLMHSFGLYSTKYKFLLINNNKEKLITYRKIKKKPFKLTVINVWKLYVIFMGAVEKYYDSLKKYRILRENFNDMFEYYGISIQGPLDKVIDYYENIA